MEEEETEEEEEEERRVKLISFIQLQLHDNPRRSMMISERHKTLNLVTIISCWLCLYAACPATCAADEVFEVLPQSVAATATGKSGSQQDEVNGLAFVTPNATTAPRLDPNNNNEWRPLGHGDPLQKDPTYDYSPPALDRVRYWAENNASSSDARQKQLPAEVLRNKTKSEILLLGVPGERERSRPKQPKQPQAKYAPIRRSYYAPPQQQQQQVQQVQHMPHTHLMPPPMLMKGMGHVEYRHSPSSSSYMSMNMGGGVYSSPGKQSSSTHYYSSPSAATTSWFSHSPTMSEMPHRMSYMDAHHQESMQHYSLSRPQAVSYAPNSIHAHSTTGARKPWLHELLQKELVVKSTMKQRMKPTMPATKYLMGTTRPQLPAASPTTHAPLTYSPVTFVPGPPTVATPTTSSTRPEVYITPSTLMSTGSSGFRPMVGSTTTTTTTATPIYQRPETTSTTSSSRLMIPQTSNLAQRPTVAPAPELTTDALFSHYKQPPKPLLGPMYLIIEGHSKVKTYGQNELDPHSPKIVPVISKREPVVRIADPNEQRGTVETYQVKHLHTKTTPLTTTTTTSTTTTARPSTTEGSSMSPSTEMPPGGGVHDLLSLLDNMFADAHDMAATSSTTAGSSSLATASASTVLRPVTTTKTKLQPQLPEPRIGSQAGSIESQLETEVTDGSQLATSTEPEQPPRATRQIFDYDQLPESRIKAEAPDELDYEADYDDDADEANDNDNVDGDNLEDVSEDSQHNLLKRIDRFVDDVDDGDDDLDDLIDDNDNDDDDADADVDADDGEQQQAEESRQQQRQQQQHH
ncbi:mucin-2 [Drosophila montana]|uniref:mucin-2 n=1 Tax=Drosophila montana TaxID=40370 RepID=UPI00313E3330